MLEEQELVASKVEAGKKIYSLTDKGKAAAEGAEEKHRAHWEERDKYIMSFKVLKPVFFETIANLKEIASHNSEEKIAKAKAILEEANKKLEKITIQEEKIEK
jgi:DNA-binding PadR family transcriptional regulator